jgi:hypothetical protein
MVADDAARHFMLVEKFVPERPTMQQYIMEIWNTVYDPIHPIHDIRLRRERNSRILKAALNMAMETVESQHGHVIPAASQQQRDPLFAMLSRDGVLAQRRNLNDFNDHMGKGAASAILVLGSSFSTGVDVNGAAAEMHVLDVLPNDAMETQVKGRVSRNCSHARLPKSQWVVKYLMYETVFDQNELMPSCDTVLHDYKQRSDSIMKALADVVKLSSFGCRLMHKHHKHAVGDCLT